MSKGLDEINRLCGTLAGYHTHYRRKEVACGLCKAAVRISSAKWRSTNLEKSRISGRTWRRANPAYSVAWAKNNRDKLRGNNRRWCAQNEGREWEFYTEAQVLETYGTDCHICEEPIDLTAPRWTGNEGWERGLNLDHVIPVSKGGADTLANVKPAHGLCNRIKSDTLQEKVG